MRVFVGVPLPEDIRERLSRLCTGLPGARWVDKDRMHITLRFIGDVSGDRADDIHLALSAIRAPAFDLTLSGVGCFESGRRVRALWAGVTRSEPLAHLHGKVESAIVRAGFEPEGRKFKPHVTLARFRNAKGVRIGPYIEAHNPFSAGPFRVTRFALVRSHLGSNGPHYEALAEYPLG